MVSFTVSRQLTFYKNGQPIVSQDAFDVFKATLIKVAMILGNLHLYQLPYRIFGRVHNINIQAAKDIRRSFFRICLDRI
jgi:hypothetical protein